MSEFLFFVKMTALTAVLVLVMQVQVGERSLEDHAMGWVQSSALVAPLNAVAHGGAKMIRDASEKIHAAIAKRQGQEKKSVGGEPGSEKTQTPSAPSSFRWDSVRGRTPASAPVQNP